jgi:hypothetical protein
MSLAAVPSNAEGLLEATIFCAPVTSIYKTSEGATPDEIFSSGKYYKDGSGA